MLADDPVTDSQAVAHAVEPVVLVFLERDHEALADEQPRAEGNERIVLMHGFQNKPTRLADTDLHMIERLRRDFRLPVGIQDHADGGSVSWKNEDNGYNGKLTGLETYAEFGTTCRRMRVFSDAIEVSASRIVNMCKNKKGEWKILN